jgi:chorismate mutase-like protein
VVLKESDWKEKSLSIEELRNQIDKIDNRILELLNKRARLALQIGKIKQTKNLPVYVPGRENQILERLQTQNQGPLGNDAIARLYQKIIEESRNLEDGLT